MATSTYTVDKRDVNFVLWEFLKADQELAKLPKFADFDRGLYDSMINEAAKLAINEIAPINKICDQVGAKFDAGKVTLPKEVHAVYKKYCEGGWCGLGGSPDFGGQGMPYTVGLATAEFFMGANVAFTMYPGLTGAAARVILHYGTDDMKKKYLEKLYSGEWQGTMCLTEPGAGTDVGNAKTTAKPNGDTYIITGNKIFISAGEHDMCDNFIHLVLARIDGAPKGTAGISLFIVPKYLVNEDGSIGEFNDMGCVGIEHKMGIKGSATCTLSFGDNGKCKGWLIGEANKGMKYMFMMMNEARMGVGIHGYATGAAAYYEALTYARERLQGSDLREMKNPDAPRVAISRHPDIRRNLWTMKAYVEGCRALLFQSALWGDIAEYSTDEDAKAKGTALMELMTPICKAYSSDMGFRVTELAVQTFGGYGYCSEYPVEQYMRDNKIASIFEGANGIQALDLLGRKLAMKGGMYFMTYSNEIELFCEANVAHPKLGKMVQAVKDAKDKLMEAAMSFNPMMGGNPMTGVYHALPFLYMFGDVTLAWLHAQMALVAQSKLDEIVAAKGAAEKDAYKALLEANPEAKFYDNKVTVAQFFVSQLLPRIAWFGAAMQSGDLEGLKKEP